jgi:protein involved in polysaccharide export with SLBB domain
MVMTHVLGASPRFLRGAVTVFLVLALGVSAAGAPAQAPPAPSGEAGVGPGDVLDVLVVGEPDFSRSVQVSGEGNVFLPLVGNVSVMGLTIKQVEQKLTTALSKYVKDPKVLVTFRQSVPERELIYVLGQANKPGPYDFRRGITVAELLALAGGTTDKAALRRAMIIRRTVTSPVNLERLLSGDTSQNPPLQAGDVLVIPENTMRVLVLGQINKPGYQPLKDGDRIIDVLTNAGGPTLAAAPERISIIREGQPVKADLEAFLRFGDMTQNVAMLPGDIVFLPETDRRILVLGQVPKPGPYQMTPGVAMRVMDAIMLAGGPAQGASLKGVLVVRQSGDKPTGIPVDMWKFLQEGALEQNIVLKPGDVVFVPAGFSVVLSELFGVLSGLSFLRLIFGIP